MNNWILIVGYASIFLLLFLFFFLLLQSVSLMQAAKDNMTKIIRGLYDRNDRRVLQAEQARRKYGTTALDGKKEGLLTRILSRLDDLLVYSEISIRYEWMNASVYLIGDLILSSFALLLGTILANVFVGIFLCAAVVIIPCAILVHKTNENYSLTEEQLEFFIDLVGSNAAVSGDLLTVLEVSAPYASDPIRSAIYRAVAVSKVSGKSEDGIWLLIRELEHPLFCGFLRDLSICSEHDASYRSVAKDYAVQAEQSISALTKLREGIADAHGEILGMVGIGIFCSFLTADFCGINLFSLMQEMSGSMIGVACLVVEGLIYGSTLVYLLLSKGR